MYFKLLALAGLLTIQAAAASIDSGDKLTPREDTWSSEVDGSHDFVNGHAHVSERSTAADGNAAPLRKRKWGTTPGYGDCDICSFGTCTAAAKEFCEDLAKLYKQQHPDPHTHLHPTSPPPAIRTPQPKGHGHHRPPVAKRANVDSKDDNDFDFEAAHALGKRDDDKASKGKHSPSWYFSLGHIRQAIAERCAKDPKSCAGPAAPYDPFGLIRLRANLEDENVDYQESTLHGERKGDDLMPELEARDQPKALGRGAYVVLPENVLNWFKNPKSGSGSAMRLKDKDSHKRARRDAEAGPGYDSHGYHHQHGNGEGDSAHHHHHGEQHPTSTAQFPSEASEWHNPLESAPLPMITGYGP